MRQSIDPSDHSITSFDDQSYTVGGMVWKHRELERTEMFGHSRPTTSYPLRRWNYGETVQSFSPSARLRNGPYGAHRMLCTGCWHDVGEATSHFAGQLAWTMCHRGVPSERGASALVVANANVRNIAGGMSSWPSTSLTAEHGSGSPSKVA